MMAFTAGTALTHTTAMTELKTGLDYIAKNSAEVVRIDCASLVQFDSSALAVLLAWLRAARAQGKALEVLHAPTKLAHLAQAYGVDELLKL
ncbi:lipid asymmetry maintenance protein MlaB [Mycoavidus sp. B2-EB]|uniref:STAS domain-containing protein n=1 Tax=Mycoavidus sp. B2-EB TaxID=2651972 RepID=UPI00162ACCAA|nr:STAS domain-containing protein [Mycoavidus sp. B2-EB]BBO59179.1 hypothetical protein MPB2EB_0284 [Mycoavidus sp. B2-EB]